VSPLAGYALAYDAARKALTAILENQGLRPTTRGGHLAVYEAVRAQLEAPMGRLLRTFNRMRTRRHDAEYPPTNCQLCLRGCGKVGVHLFWPRRAHAGDGAAGLPPARVSVRCLP
jgi:hypothetical protein